MKKTLLVSTALFLSFLSLLAVIITARMLGFDPASFHDPERILLPSTVLTALSIFIVPILIVVAFQRVALGQRLAPLRFNGPFLGPLLVGGLLGSAMKAASTTLAVALTDGVSLAPSIPSIALSAALPYFSWFLFSLLFNSLSEELVYRVFPIVNLAVNSTPRSYIVVGVTAALFSLAHFTVESPDTIRFLYRVAFGLFVGLFFLKTRSLWYVVGMHTGWNIIAHLASDEDWRLGTLLKISGLSPGREGIANVLVLAIGAAFLWVLTCSKSARSLPK